MKILESTPIILSLCLCASTAQAQPATQPEEPAAEEPPPSFATLDRMSTDSRLASSLGFVRTEDFGFAGAASGFRLDLYGQYVSRKGFGGYGAVPIAYVTADGDSETAIGSFELGGLFLPKGMPVPLILRGGFVLGNAGLSDWATNTLAAYSRLGDFVTALPDTAALRASASAMMRSGNLFFRGDAGIDLPISEPEGFDANTLGRLNVGAGIMTGDVAVMGELVNLVNLEADDAGEERFLHVAAVTARYTRSTVHPSLTLSMPLDEGARDIISFIVIAGIEYRLQTK